MPQVVPGEVGNLGDLKGGMESVLDVLDRFALAGARLVWEDPRALGVRESARPESPRRLAGAVHSDSTSNRDHR